MVWFFFRVVLKSSASNLDSPASLIGVTSPIALPTENFELLSSCSLESTSVTRMIDACAAEFSKVVGDLTEGGETGG